ncbi:hypothetical protein TNCV_5113571 [Trichonephila clavipes]|nr:hypothetical protein TNCV_5113571 [Trichonephila clavipes]
MMVWDAIGYTSQSPLVRIDGTLNGILHFWCVTTRGSTHYSSHLTLYAYQDNARPYVTGIVRTFLKCSTACTFSRSFTNRKRLACGCRATGLSPYASHYSL